MTNKLIYTVLFWTCFSINSMENANIPHEQKSSSNSTAIIPVGYQMDNPCTQLSKEEQQEFFKRDLATRNGGKLSEVQIASLAETAAEEMCSLEEKKIRETDMDTLSDIYAFNKDKKVRRWDTGGTFFGVLRNILYPLSGLCAAAIPIGAVLEFPVFSQAFNRYATCATGVFAGLATGCHKISVYMYGRRDERKAMLLRREAYGSKMTTKDFEGVVSKRFYLRSTHPINVSSLTEHLLPKKTLSDSHPQNPSSPILEILPYEVQRSTGYTSEDNNKSDDDDN